MNLILKIGQQFSNYSGEFYIEIKTEHIITDVDLVDELNNHSSRLINGEGYSRWQMNGLSEALNVVLQLQTKKYPFRFIGDGNILFIEDLGGEL